MGRINYYQVKRKVKYFIVCCRDVRFVNLMRAVMPFSCEDGVDLVTIIMGTSFYHRARYLDYASDYLPPSPSELKKIHESLRWIEVATSPVMLSTLEDGKVVRGLAGIPSEGPVLLVGYHMLLGLEMVPIVSSFWAKRNILLRGIAHPMMYRNLRNGESPLIPDISTYDILRIMGAGPVSVTNFYKLLSSNAHVLLYPGGMREGEEYKLFWPEQSEFVRLAARFGATIIPFGSVGEDDIGQLLVDYDDLMKVPHIKAKIKEVAEAVLQSSGKFTDGHKAGTSVQKAGWRPDMTIKINKTLGRELWKTETDDDGELGNQDPHLPLILTKLPGRFYNLFGKPIETEGRKRELRNRDKSQELYLEVKSEVERCMAYLKDKREHDPYRNILPQTIYQAMHGFDCEVPTFKL
ncbi:unnamed protein product [Camellia sinensis]